MNSTAGDPATHAGDWRAASLRTGPITGRRAAGYTASQGDRRLRPLWVWTIAGLRAEGAPIATIAAGAGITRGAVWQTIRAARGVTAEGVAVRV